MSILTRSRSVLTPEEFRSNFPALTHTVHLASCSLGARSTAVDAALTRMLDAMGAHGAPWPQFEDEVETARRGFATLIGARPDQVAVVPNASVGAYQAVSTLDLSRRHRLVTTVEEFPSVAHVWLAQRARGAEVGYAPGSPMAVDADSYRAVLDERVALVSVPLVTYRYGARLPVPEVATMAHAAGARVFVDAYQAAGVLPVDVDELGCDYLVAGSMKYLLGLPGVAFLYARSASAGDHDPVLTGWFGRVDPFAFDPTRLDFPAAARRFETGTAAVPAIYAANAGLQLINGLDRAGVARHVTGLVTLAADRLAAQGEQLRLTPDPAAQGAHVGLVDRDPPALARWLAERGIVVSPRGPVVRISFHYYNHAPDVAALCTALEEFRSTQEQAR